MISTLFQFPTARLGKRFSRGKDVSGGAPLKTEASHTRKAKATGGSREKEGGGGRREAQESRERARDGEHLSIGQGRHDQNRSSLEGQREG